MTTERVNLTRTPAERSEKRIYTIWPDGKGQAAWRQEKRWMLLDVTAGIDRAEILMRGTRSEVITEEMRLRSEQGA